MSSYMRKKQLHRTNLGKEGATLSKNGSQNKERRETLQENQNQENLVTFSKYKEIVAEEKLIQAKFKEQ